MTREAQLQIDRVVHHAVILDLMGMESYRAKEANGQHAQLMSETAPALAGTEEG